MKERLKAWLMRTPFYWPVYSLHYRIFHWFCIPRWIRAGCPVPPPYPVKQQKLRDCAREFGLQIFVETGTCHGDTIFALRNEFVQLYSIELCRTYYDLVVRRFRRLPQVHLVLGDSAVELRGILNQIRPLNQRQLFWLDGHYSGADSAKGEMETPIFQELDHILADPQTLTAVIAIDDAREFGGNPNYPSFDQVVAFVKSRRNSVTVSVNTDIIWITPSVTLP
jgi:hypothetical protein